MLTFCLIAASCPVQAVEHWASDEIDFAISNGFWKLGDFEPDSPVTRAEVAGLVSGVIGAAVPEMRNMYSDVDASTTCGREIIAVSLAGIMQGADKLFRPNDSLSREELAVVLNRMYAMLGEKMDAKVVKSRFYDSDTISEWALQSIYNLAEAKIMNGTSPKNFAPKKTTSKAEAITAMVNYYNQGGMKTPNYSVRDASDINPKDNFKIYQSGRIVQKAGVSGWSIVAQFDGAPGEIYVSRTTDSTRKNTGVIFEPTAIARVTDPDGNVAAVADFSELKNGKMAKIINIPEGKAGNWTIAVMNGKNEDLFEIGINDAKYWGIRGEKVLKTTETMPQEMYVYVQSKADDIYIGVRDTTHSTKLFDLNGKLIAQAGKPSGNLAHANSSIETNQITPGSVYKLVLPKNYQDQITIEGIPGLMCPTAEAAAAIKGGWVEYDGILFQTPIAARARAEIVRLASTKDLSVNIEYPENYPTDLKNPQAEAQMFGEYGVISSLSESVNRQILDPKNKWCGRVLDQTEFKEGKINEIRNNTGDFESGFYAAQEGSRAGQGALGMATAATMPLELNYAYGNDALITRAAMGILVTSYGLSEDGYYRTYTMVNNTYPMIGGMFIWSYIIEAYELIRGRLEQSTREIIDQMMALMADKQGDYFGLGVNNQGMFCVRDRLIWYKMTGDERHHDAFKRLIQPFIHKTDSQYGYQQPGHFAEIGCDGSYEYMGRVEFYAIYNIYKKLKNADPEILEGLRFVVEDTIYFEACHTLPQPEASSMVAIGPNHFSSRTDTPLGTGNNPSYEQVFDEFPMAARRMQVYKSDRGVGYPHRVNTDEFAYLQMERYYADYHTYGEKRNQGRYGHWWPNYTYGAYNADEYVEPCKLPCEEDDGLIIDRDGFIAVKHKGIYLSSFYETEVLDTYWINTSYAYMGGGPTAIWNDKIGSTLVSQKHYSGTKRPSSMNDILSSCITGEAGNKFFYSGKEKAAFKWLEQNKKFEIRGLVPDSGKNAVWTYELTDTGIDMTAGIETMASTDTLWVNLPIVMNDAGNGADIKVEPGKLTFSFNGGTMTYTWDASLEYEFLDPKVRVENASFSRLRVKIPPEIGSVKFSIEVTK